MTKQDIINHVSQEASLSRSKAEEAVETVIKLIKEEVEDGIANVEKLMNSKFGDKENPCLVSGLDTSFS